MKKLIILIALAFTTLGYSQAEFEKIALTENGVSTSTNKINTQEPNGEINFIDAANLPVSTATENALFAKKDATSTAVTSTATLTNNGSTFTLSPLTGVIVDNSTVPSTRTVINFAGASNVTPLYFRTLLYIDNTGTLQQMNGMATDLTPQQRVDNLFIGIVVYSGGTVQVVQLIPDIEYSIDNRFSTLTDFIRNINEGNNIGANGANLQVNKGAGYTFRRGSNFATNREVPDVTTDVAQTPIPASPNLIGYRNGSGGWTYEPYTGSLTPQFWDNGTGIKATVANNKFTNVRDYFFNGTNTHVFYLGRTEHATLEAAATAAQSPDAIVDPATSVGSLIGTISVAYNATALNNTAQARFTQGPRMQGGSGAGGASGSQNLQNTYLNSSVPQITTTALGAVTVQEGTGTDSNNILVGKNNAGTTTFSVSGEGKINLGNGTSASPSILFPSEVASDTGINHQNDGAIEFVLNGSITSSVDVSGYKSNSFIKTGGLSSEFLKADGSSDSTVYQPLLTNPITGSLNLNYIPKSNGSNSITDSQITDVGTGIGIGVTNPMGIFEVYESLKIRNPLNQFERFNFGWNSGVAYLDAYNFNNGTRPNISIQPDGGKVFIGKSTDDGGGSLVQVLGGISATSYTGGATLTGTPTAPTAPSGTNTTQIATTAFVQSADAGNVKLTSNQSISGNKTFTNTGTSGVVNGISLINNGTTNAYSLFLDNNSTGIGILSRNDSSGIGHQVTNSNTGTGTYYFNTSSGNSIFSQNDSTGNGFVSNGGAGSSGFLYIGRNNGTNTFTVTKEGIQSLGTYTVATLPTPATSTAYATVTDATAPTYLGTLTGGGSVVCPVFYNGSAWVSH